MDIDPSLKSDRYRKLHAVSHRLQYIVLFGAPLVFTALLFLVLATIYVLLPYLASKSFSQTTCWIDDVQIKSDVVASCNAGTDPFIPCIKVYIFYVTEVAGETRKAVLLENEQALFNCNQNKCSYTFGRHSLFHGDIYDCGTWRENFDVAACADRVLQRHNSTNGSFTCYFNPMNREEVVRNLDLSLNTVIYAYAWPLLSCILYVVLCATLSYSKQQQRLLKTYHEKKVQEMKKAARRRKIQLNQCLGLHISAGGKQRANIRAVCQQAAENELDNSHESDLYSADVAVAMETKEYDMRHLDLAVTEQNIDDLATTYAYLASSIVHSEKTDSNAHVWFNNSNQFHTLPAALRSRKQRRSCRRAFALSQNAMSFCNETFEASDTSPDSVETVSITTNTMLSEREIDMLYQEKSRNKRTLTFATTRSETAV